MTHTPGDMAAAVEEYRDRQSRRSHPRGRTDNGGRWYPSDSERQECCDLVRSPSRAHPWSLMLHCRTAEHVAHLHGVDPAELRRAARAAAAGTRILPCTAYKAVAIHPDTGEYVSIYDGTTIYRIGEEIAQAARQNHSGGIYCYVSMQRAINAELPSDSVGLHWPRIIIEGQAWGSYCTYGSGKIAVGHFRPTSIVSTMEVAE